MVFLRVAGDEPQLRLVLLCWIDIARWWRIPYFPLFFPAISCRYSKSVYKAV